MLGTTKWRGCGFILFLVHCGNEALPGSAADGGKDAIQPTYTVEQLKDPETCNKCHSKHFRDWSGSMHAYASNDPLFLAMNERGQREANIGNFCVQCHAPMAVLAAGPSKVVDTEMLRNLKKEERGITCYFCHNVDSVGATHNNNPLVLAGDNVMRGRLSDAVANEAHRSSYSKLLDGTQLESATMCGACHDIVNGKGTPIERTFKEWKDTVFNTAITGQTCTQCHAPQAQRPELIADGPLVTGVFARFPHDHKMPGVDRAITAFPELTEQTEAVKRELNYPPVFQSGLCFAYYGGGDGKIVVISDNLQAGHMVPSGAAQDRQVWFEVTAFDAAGNEIYKSGHTEDGHDPSEVDPAVDPDIWLMRDCMFDNSGAKTHMFWESASNESNVLPGPVTLSPLDPRFYQMHLTRAFPMANSARLKPVPARMTLKAWFQPFPYEVFDELKPEFERLGYNDAEILGMRGKLAPIQVTTQTTADSIEAGVLEWTETSAETSGAVFSNGGSQLVKDIPVNILMKCVTGTNMQLGVDTRSAPRRINCKP